VLSCRCVGHDGDARSNLGLGSGNYQRRKTESQRGHAQRALSATNRHRRHAAGPTSGPVKTWVPYGPNFDRTGRYTGDPYTGICTENWGT
jgi:hypothetical protein